jgi:hypothetical protein
MKDQRYMDAFDTQLDTVEEPQEPSEHEKLMQAYERLHQKMDQTIERIRTRRQKKESA